jgi:hypothetical protein
MVSPINVFDMSGLVSFVPPSQKVMLWYPSYNGRGSEVRETICGPRRYCADFCYKVECRTDGGIRQAGQRGECDR